MSPPGQDSHHHRLHRDKLLPKAGDRPIELFPKQTRYHPPDRNRHANQQNPHHEPPRIEEEGRTSSASTVMDRIGALQQHTPERPDDFRFKNAAASKREQQSPPLTRRHPLPPCSAGSPGDASQHRTPTGPRSPQASKHGSHKHPVRNLDLTKPALPQRAAPSIQPNVAREPTSKAAAASWNRFPPVDSSVKSRPHIHIAAGSIFASSAAYQIIKGHVKQFNPVDTWLDDNGYYIVFPKTDTGLRDMARCEKAHRNTKLFQRHLLNMKLYPDGQLPVLEDPKTNIVGPAEVSSKHLCSKDHRMQDSSSRDTYSFVRKASEEAAAAEISPSPQPSSGLQELRKLFPVRSPTPLERDPALLSPASVKSHSASKLEKDDTSSTVSGTTSQSRTKMGSQACHKCPSMGGQLFNCTTCKRRYHRQCLSLHITPDDIDEWWQCERCVRKGVPKRSPEDHVSTTHEGEQMVCSAQARPAVTDAAPVNMATSNKTNITHGLQHNPPRQHQQIAVETPETIPSLANAATVHFRAEVSIEERPAAEPVIARRDSAGSARAERSAEPQQLNMAPSTSNAMLEVPVEDIVDAPEVEAADDLVEKSFSIDADKPSVDVKTGFKKGLIIKRVKTTSNPKLRDEHHAVPAVTSPSIPQGGARSIDPNHHVPSAMNDPVAVSLGSAEQSKNLQSATRVQMQHDDGILASKASQMSDDGHTIEAVSASNIPLARVADNMASCASPADSVLEERTLSRPSIAKVKRNPVAPVPCSICKKTKVPHHPSGRSICTKCKRSDIAQKPNSGVASGDATPQLEPSAMVADSPGIARLEAEQTHGPVQAEAAEAHVDAASNIAETSRQQALVAGVDGSDNSTSGPTGKGESTAPPATLTATSIPQKRKPEPTTREDIFDLGNSMQRPKNTYWKLISMALCAAPEHRLQPLAVASWVAKNIPGYNLKEGSWAGSLKACLIHNTNGELGRQICSVVQVRGSDGTLEKWYELLPGLEFRLMQWDSVLQRPFMQASPISLGALQSQAEGEEVMEPWRSKDSIAKKRRMQLGKSTGPSSQSQSFDGSMASTQETINKTCAPVDEGSSEDEPLAWGPRRRQHPLRPNMAPTTQDSHDCSGQPGVSPMEIDEISTLLHAAAQSPREPSDEETRAFEEIDDDSSFAEVPEENDQSELRELIRQGESEAAYTERSLFEAWPEYDPRNQFDAATKIAEIAKRPRKKQLFGTPAFFSPLGEQPFLRVYETPASTAQNSPVKRAATSRAHEAPDKTDATTVRTFDTLDEFFGLNNVDFVPFIEDGQICFKHKNGKRGVFKTGI
ncbi:hypothetical protein AC578_7249 [Pseudocercospora eumusae]|uniref:PHD-type domain-containing protein n=1 Tax=Pseudocercospora eumusae TaxID=321146 RepID=A0A139HX67_9PEZI|nr:hypothetical protein AC578_7249 [Pseudocercospora eumusae]